MTDGKVTAFDTPRCALTSWRSRNDAREDASACRSTTTARRATATSVRFVIGGDVVGPMGPDLVPVDPPRASKFIQDHGADRALELDEITPQVLASIGAK